MSAEEKTKPSLEKKSSDSELAHVQEKSGSEDDYDFGGESTLPPPPKLTEDEERKIWRKVDLRLMPILAVMYLFSFMDRGARRQHAMCYWVGAHDVKHRREYRYTLLFSSGSRGSELFLIATTQEMQS